MGFGMGLNMSLGAALRGAAFSPLSLFANGEDGAWYEDPGDYSTLWADSVGGTNLTGPGAFKAVSDRSGNNLHLTQTVDNTGTTASANAQGNVVLAGDGTTALQNLNNLNQAATGYLWTWLVVASESVSGAVFSFSHGTNDVHYNFSGTLSSNRPRSAASRTVKTTLGDPKVFMTRYDRASGEIRGFVNGAEVSLHVVADAPTLISTAADIKLFGDSRGTSTAIASVISAGILCRDMTESEQRQLVQYLLGISGIDAPNLFGRLYGSISEANARPARLSSGGIAVGYTDADGGVRVAEITNGAPSSAAFLRHISQNDHHNPGVLRRQSDGKILAISAGHNSNDIFLHVSDAADDVSSFNAGTDIASQLTRFRYTYPNMFQLTGEIDSPIYLFTRAASSGTYVNWGPYFSKSTDGGATWSAATHMVLGWRPYLSATQNGNARIDFTVNNTLVTDADCNNYHFYYEGDKFYDSAGSELTLPIDLTTDLTPIYTGGSGLSATQGQPEIDASGNPVVFYSVLDRNSGTSKETRCARWNGSAWSDSKIVDSPSRGGGLDPSNTNVAYVCKEDAGGVAQLYRFTWDGSAWDGGVQITAGSQDYQRTRFIAGDNPRALVIRGEYSGNYEAFGPLWVDTINL